MSDKYCPYCTPNTAGQHEYNCPSGLYPVSMKIERMGDLDGYEALKEHHKAHHTMEAAELARYREALEWYADKEHYPMGYGPCEWDENKKAWKSDNDGDRARAALRATP